MKNYHLTDNFHFTRGWTWGWSVMPHPVSMGKLCDICGKGRLYPGRYPAYSMSIEVGKGTKYPDVLGTAHSILAISEAVLKDWQAYDVTGYNAYPLTVVKATGCISEVPPPQYYHIEVTGQCALNLEAMGIRTLVFCPKCGYHDYELVDEGENNPFSLHPFVIRDDVPIASDLFVSELFERVRFCSQKIVDIAREKQHTNFRFEVPETMGLEDAVIVNYLAK